MNVQQVTNAIAKVGKPGVLRRIVPGGRHRPLRVRHLSTNYQPHELVGGILEGDQKVTISNAEIEEHAWPGPPVRGDQMFIKETRKTGTVQAVQTMHLGEDPAMHIMQVRGL